MPWDFTKLELVDVWVYELIVGHIFIVAVTRIAFDRAVLSYEITYCSFIDHSVHQKYRRNT